MAQSGSCITNLCFVFDGSNTLNDSDFQLQSNFASIISAVFQLDFPKTTPISQITTSADNFLLSLENVRFANAQRTSLAPGINFCRNAFAQRPGQANKIVVFSDGRGLTSNSISDGADNVCAVGVGNQNSEVLRAIAGGDASQVFQVNDTAEFLNAVQALFRNICQN